jgi:hypothetical protein
MDPKYANAGQDSTFYFDANLDPYPGFDFDAGSGFNFSLLCRYGFGVPKNSGSPTLVVGIQCKNQKLLKW